MVVFDEEVGLEIKKKKKIGDTFSIDKTG